MLIDSLVFDNHGDIKISSIIEYQEILKSYEFEGCLTKKERKELKTIFYILSMLYDGQKTITQRYFNQILNDSFLYDKKQKLIKPMEVTNYAHDSIEFTIVDGQIMEKIK